MNEARAARFEERLTSGPWWESRRLQRLFDRYNERFFGRRLAGWKAIPFSGKVKGVRMHCLGHCADRAKVIRISCIGHTTDLQVRRTLIHEMAHGVTSGKHDDEWLTEMKRLRRAGAPTDPMDFFVPYGSGAHVLVEAFENAAQAGASWEEAFNAIFDETPRVEVYKQCRRFFRRAERKRKRTAQVGGAHHDRGMGARNDE